MIFLTKVTEEYRVDSEEEATEMIENAKNTSTYVLSKYSSQYKEKKQKGEVVDSYFKVTLTKEFTSEREPERQTKITYEKDSAY